MIDFLISDKRGQSLLYILCGMYVLTVFAPALIYGVKESADIIHHLSWYLSFQEEISWDNPYPRWLSTQYDGFGSPAFYFYPPFTTYFLSFTNLVTFQLLPTEHVFALAVFILSLLSGVAFYIWIRIYTRRPFSVIAATLYAVAPYHLLINFYERAALAEFAAYIWVPLIFAASHHLLQQKRRLWVFVLVLSVAGLFLTHLLTALMVGPLVAVFILLSLKEQKLLATKQGFQELLYLGFLAVIGMGMAAIYYIPALSLMEFINQDALYRKQIEWSYIYNGLFEGAHNQELMLSIFGVATVYLLLGLYAFSGYVCLKKKCPEFQTQHTLFWIIIIPVCYLLMCGVCSFLFKDPSPYRNIQFTWRLLIIVEFAAITCAAIFLTKLQGTSWFKPSSLVLGVFLGGLLCAQALGIADHSRGIAVKSSPVEWGHVEKRLSPDEYFPHGLNSYEGMEIIPLLEKYQKKQFIASVSDGEGHIVKAQANGEQIVIESAGNGPTTILVHQFYFPRWEATDEKGNIVTLSASDADKMVSYTVSAGHHQITLTPIVTKPERIGAIISALSILLLCGVLLFLPVFVKRI